MTSHLLYEGPELEQLLERVRSTHGADVAIVSANKIRRGGVAGFFAKEMFQVTVEALPSAAGAGGPLPHDDSSVGDGPDADLWRMLLPDKSAERASTEDAGVGVAASEPSETENFAAMLDRLVAEHMMAEAATDKPAPAPAFHPVALSEEWTPPPPPPPAPPVMPLTSKPGADPTITTRRMPSPMPPNSDEDASVIALRPRRVRRTASSLGGLDELLVQFENAWLEAGPLPSSGITVVVGERDDARRVAATMATTLGIAVDDVVVASPYDAAAMPSRSELAQVIAVLEGQGPASILVVELEPGIAGHEWARAVIGGVDPARVDLATDAAGGFDQVRRTVIAIGGVDAIDLLGVAASHAAEELLEMYIPIATLDGRPASPALWAATVLSRPGASVVNDADDLVNVEAVAGTGGRRSEERRSLGSTP